MRKLRWIIYAPVALIALFASPAIAQEYITWTCTSSTSWQMFQPVADYEAGFRPNWSDCERWKDGTPDDPYVWSYGTSVESTTTTSEPATTTTEEEEATSSTTSTTSLPESTTTQPEPTTTTTSLPTTTATPISVEEPPVETIPDTTVVVTTSTVEPVSTSSSVVSTTTSGLSPLPSSSVPDEIETVSSSVAPSPTFISSESVLESPDFDAPDDVKKEFESSVNIFDGSHDDYVPLGSNITVAQRRTIVAATTILMALPTPVSRRKT